jgi:uncharacterized coiled-coil protein SlyX
MSNEQINELKTKIKKRQTKIDKLNRKVIKQQLKLKHEKELLNSIKNVVSF